MWINCGIVHLFIYLYAWFFISILNNLLCHRANVKVSHFFSFKSINMMMNHNDVNALFFRMKTTKFNMLSLIKPTNIISIVLCQFCHSFSIRKRNINILLNAADWIQGSAFNSFEMPKHFFIKRKFHITFIQLLDQE